MNSSFPRSAAKTLVIGLSPILAACSTVQTDSAPSNGTIAALAGSAPHLSMKARGNGLMISYQDNRSNALMLAYCPADCAKPASSWRVTEISSAGRAGVYTSLNLDHEYISIGYHDYLSGDLKLATCVASCTSDSASWRVSTVDRGAFAGPYTAVGLSAGKPVVSYYDQNRQELKLASCLEDCFSVSPRWQISTIDSGDGGIGTPPSLQLQHGKPVISYYKHRQGVLKLATCLDRCMASNPDWRIVTVDASGDVGESASLQMKGDKPVISYRDVRLGTIKLATCIEDCTSSHPLWRISTLDTGSHTRGFTSLQLRDGKPVIGFYDASRASLELAVCQSECTTAAPVWGKVSMGHGRFSGTHTSLQLSDDVATIGYYDLSTGSINYAVMEMHQRRRVPMSHLVMN